MAGEQLLNELELDPSQRTAQSLVPGIQSILKGVGWAVAELELVAVTQGPGSFTGLRVGVTTAKTLAYVTGAEVMGVNTLEAIAEQTSHRPLWAVLDAQRQQLFAVLLDDSSQLPQSSVASQIVDSDAWIRDLESGMAVTGPGLHKLSARLPQNVTVIDEALWHPKAATVGQIGYRQYQQGRRDDLWRLVPQYFRKSAAEEKHEQ